MFWQRREVRMDNKNITSVMQMEKIVFDKIEFNRVGFKNNEDINFEIQTHIAEHASEHRYKVNLVVKGDKAKEYNLEISLTGFFNLKENSGLPKTVENALISKNAVAILMPYMRSEITLLTAQPEVDSVSLPLFNINNMFEK